MNMQLIKKFDHRTPAQQRIQTLYHTHPLSPNQCTSIVRQMIDAPLPLVWSILRKFSNPQSYKQFIKSCDMVSGNGAAGSVREVTIVSGLPAGKSTERLDRLDDDLHLMVVSIVGGDHKLLNYKSTTTVHEEEGEEEGGRTGTMVMESYVVDVPADSCEEDTCLFADTIIGCNLKSLAKLTEKLARQDVGTHNALVEEDIDAPNLTGITLRGIC